MFVCNEACDLLSSWRDWVEQRGPNTGTCIVIFVCGLFLNQPFCFYKGPLGSWAEFAGPKWSQVGRTANSRHDWRRIVSDRFQRQLEGTRNGTDHRCRIGETSWNKIAATPTRTFFRNSRRQIVVGVGRLAAKLQFFGNSKVHHGFGRVYDRVSCIYLYFW